MLQATMYIHALTLLNMCPQNMPELWYCIRCMQTTARVVWETKKHSEKQEGKKNMLANLHLYPVHSCCCALLKLAGEKKKRGARHHYTRKKSKS
jgi:hypothetical protein